MLVIEFLDDAVMPFHITKNADIYEALLEVGRHVHLVDGDEAIFEAVGFSKNRAQLAPDQFLDSLDSVIHLGIYKNDNRDTNVYGKNLSIVTGLIITTIFTRQLNKTSSLILFNTPMHF